MIDLNKHRAQIYSQSGEDGIIQKIFETLNINTGWYCEFGAGDGNWIPNTKKLREEGWKGVLIEGDAESFKNLKDNLGNNPDVELINSYVSCEESESLDYILSNTNIPLDIDLLSIDVDGNDLWIWKSLKKYSPKVVVIEYNPSKDPTESYTIEYDKNHRFNSDSYYGATPGALNKIAEEKGYFLVASTPRTNLFYCRKEFANNFKKMELAEVDKGIGWPISKKEMIKY
jgi:hypothetical protein